MHLPPPDKLHFLIVDDMDNMRRSIRAMLRLINFGKEFYESPNGRDALRLLESEEYIIHFIISDWNMPHMKGTDLLNRVRASKTYRDIPFLMITAEANKEVVAEAAENDVDAYLTKPFVTASLEQKIKELLHHANNPDELTTLFRKARDFEEKGDIDGAIAILTKTLDLKKRFSKPFRELGRLFLKKNDLSKSLQFFQKATDLNRLDVTSYHYMGQIYYRLDAIDKAIDAFSKAMDISPRHADRAIKFANLLVAKKKCKEAEKILALAFRISAGSDLREDIIDISIASELWDMAIKGCRAVIAADPERQYLKKKLALALYRKGDLQEVISFLEKTIVKNPDDIEMLLLLAKSYFDSKMPIRAEKWAMRVLRLDPENAEAQELLKNCM